MQKLLAGPVEAVTVSVGYGDFLELAAPYNLPCLDRWVIVTSPDDAKTREVCRRHRLTCIATNDATRDGPFSKGRLVERGLQHLSADAWILHLDADIVMPMRARKDLERAHLDPTKIYGCDRFRVPAPGGWERLKASGWLMNPYAGHPHSVTPPPGFDVMARWAGHDGYVPIGFWQLWNRVGGEEEWRGHRAKPYPQSHGNACRTDVQHALQWDRRDRAVVPELFVAHVETGDGSMGVNWNGRTTPAVNLNDLTRPMRAAGANECPPS